MGHWLGLILALLAACPVSAWAIELGTCTPTPDAPCAALSDSFQARLAAIHDGDRAGFERLFYETARNLSGAIASFQGERGTSNRGAAADCISNHPVSEMEGCIDGLSGLPAAGKTRLKAIATRIVEIMALNGLDKGAPDGLGYPKFKERAAKRVRDSIDRIRNGDNSGNFIIPQLPPPPPPPEGEGVIFLPDALVVPVGPKLRECPARSPVLETVISACVNDVKCQEDLHSENYDCKVLAKFGLLGLANQQLLQTMAYGDADSIVVLTRARLLQKFRQAYADTVGAALSDSDFPSECRAGDASSVIGEVSRLPVTVPTTGRIQQDRDELRRSALRIHGWIDMAHRQCGGTRKRGDYQVQPPGPETELCESMWRGMNEEVLSHPLLIPGEGIRPLGTIPNDGNWAFADRIATSGADYASLMTENARKRTLAAMKEVCSASWRDLIAHPVGGQIATEVSNELSANNWALTCMRKSQDAMQDAMEAMPALCLITAGASVVFPPLGGAASVTCTAATATTVAGSLYRADELERRGTRILQCIEIDPTACNSAAFQANQAEIDEQFQQAAIALMTEGAGRAAAPILSKVMSRGLNMAAPAARRFVARLNAMRGLTGDALTAESQALMRELDEAAAARASAPRPQAVADAPPPPPPRPAAPAVEPIDPAVTASRVTRVTQAQEARAVAPLNYKNLVFNQKQALFSIVDEATPFGRALGAANDGLNRPQVIVDLANEAESLTRAKMQARFGSSAAGRPLDYDSFVEAMGDLARREGFEMGHLPEMVENRWASVPGSGGTGRCCNHEGFRHFMGDALSGTPPRLLLDPVANTPGHPEWIHYFQQLAIARELRASGMSATDFYRQLGRSDKFTDLWSALFDEGPQRKVFNAPAVLSHVLEDLGLPVRYETSLPKGAAVDLTGATVPAPVVPPIGHANAPAVWDRITETAPPVFPARSRVPQAFVFESTPERVWVGPGASKHIGEDIPRKTAIGAPPGSGAGHPTALSPQTIDIVSQNMMADLESATATAMRHPEFQRFKNAVAEIRSSGETIIADPKNPACNAPRMWGYFTDSEGNIWQLGMGATINPQPGQAPWTLYHARIVDSVMEPTTYFRGARPAGSP